MLLLPLALTTYSCSYLLTYSFSHFLTPALTSSRSYLLLFLLSVFTMYMHTYECVRDIENIEIVRNLFSIVKINLQMIQVFSLLSSVLLLFILYNLG